MSARPAPQAYLKYNPWTGAVTDGRVLQVLTTTAHTCEEMIGGWIESGQSSPEKSYALLFLDPTKPLKPSRVGDLVMAMVLFGDQKAAIGYTRNAVAKADAAYRHGRPNGELVERASYCLGYWDFAWGGSYVNEFGAVTAGSGLTAEQDTQVAALASECFYPTIGEDIDRLVDERRRSGIRQSWYNQHEDGGPDHTIGAVLAGPWVTTPPL